MRVESFCNREVVTARRDMDARDAARLMRDRRVGALVVVGHGDEPRPVGIVTDRDLAVEVLAQDAAPQAVKLEDLMARELVTASLEDGLWETLERMALHGLRRLPVVTRDNVLCGILSVDDVVKALATMQLRIAGLMLNARRNGPAGWTPD